MWNTDELIAKAKLYMERSLQHTAGDEQFTLWLLLGLEFLLRAPLAKASPALLAAPEGTSILAAVGVMVPDARPKSVQLSTVTQRLQHVVIEFDKERAEDADYLIHLRNGELHTSQAVLANVPINTWLPKLVRVVSTLAGSLGMGVNDFLEDSVAQLGNNLIEVEDRKLAHEISERIASCLEAFEGLPEGEREVGIVSGAFRAQLHRHAGLTAINQECPACRRSAYIYGRPAHQTRERVENADLVSDVTLVAEEFECPTCGLRLSTTREINAAGLPQHSQKTWATALQELYRYDPVEYEYGND